MCQHYLRVVWGGPFSPTGGGGGILPQDGDTWGSTQGWMASNQHCGVRTSLGGEGQGCSASWPLTAHGAGIITLSQILLGVPREHGTGAGPGLANARILIPELLPGLLKSLPSEAGCRGAGFG